MQTISNQIVVLPDGTLVNLFTLISQPNRGGLQGFHIAVIRSTDKGVTWSGPVIVDRLLLPRVQCDSETVCDPDTGQPVRTGDIIPDIAVNPSNGTLYAVWEDARFSNSFALPDIVLATSSSGGLTWTSPIKVNKSPAGTAAFTASVHVLPNGTVGVTHYDFRNNTPAPGPPYRLLAGALPRGLHRHYELD